MPDPTPDEQRTAEQKRRRDELLLLLLALASIDDNDIEAAKGLWEQHSQPSYRGLIDGSGKYTFDPESQLYRRQSTGRVISADELKRVSVGFALGIARDVIEPDAVRVAQGNIGIEKWAANTAQDIKDLQITQAALARGGFDKLDAAARQRIIGEIDKPPGLKFNMDRLSRFAMEIDKGRTIPEEPAGDRPTAPEQPAGEPEPPEPTPEVEGLPEETPVSEKQIVNRAGMYPRATSTTFEGSRRESHEAARDGQGRATFLYERSILGPAEDHCIDGKFTTGCVECEAAGWMPIGSLPLPGLRTCMGSCLCSMEFSLIGPAGEN